MPTDAGLPASPSPLVQVSLRGPVAYVHPTAGLRARAACYDHRSAPSTLGPVAQLGARLNGIQEVTGSIPVRSTTFSDTVIDRTIERVESAILLVVWLRIGLCTEGGEAPGWPARISPVMDCGYLRATRS